MFKKTFPWQVYIFPRMTKCTFHKFGSSGEIEKHDAMCILPLNIGDTFSLIWWPRCNWSKRHFIFFRPIRVGSSVWLVGRQVSQEASAWKINVANMLLWDFHIFKFKWSCQVGNRSEKPNIVTWRSVSAHASPVSSLRTTLFCLFILSKKNILGCYVPCPFHLPFLSLPLKLLFGVFGVRSHYYGPVIGQNLTFKNFVEKIQSFVFSNSLSCLLFSLFLFLYKTKMHLS